MQQVKEQVTEGLKEKYDWKSLAKRGCEFLGVEHPILCGAMSWVSESNLVSAISNAGGFGIIACGAMTPELLDKEITATKAKTTKNFGVNLIVMHPNLTDLIDVCIGHAIKYIVFAGGIPGSTHIQHVKEHDIKIIAFAPSVMIAKKLERSGIDALIIEGSEAGGHIGPVSTSVLAQEILPEIKNIPVFVAGGIGRGEIIANYMMMGAAGCQLGTRFVCAHESIAHQNFKKMFINSQARDAVISPQLDPDFPVIPVRALKNKAMDEFAKFQQETINKYKSNILEKKEAQLQIEHFWAGALRKAVIDGDMDSGSLMAGQSVGMVQKEESAKEIIDGLVADAIKYLY